MKTLDVHDDERGKLFEVLRFDEQEFIDRNKGQFYCFTIKPGKVRGQHYHKKKWEWFVCVSGSCKLLMKSSNEVEVHRLDSAFPKRIGIKPGISHTLENDTNTPTIMLSYSSKPFNSSEPDTFKDEFDWEQHEDGSLNK